MLLIKLIENLQQFSHDDGNSLAPDMAYAAYAGHGLQPRT